MNDVAIRVKHATWNNLKGISIEIPFGQLVCVTGVSGSGKSTFVEHCIGELAQHRHLALSGKTPPNFYEEGIHRSEVPFVSYIKQGTLRGSNRSIVGTALGIVQKLRELIIPHAEVRDGHGNVLTPLNATELVKWCQRHHPTAQLSLAVCLEHMVLGPAARYIRPALQRFHNCSFKVIDAETPYEHSDLQPAKKYVGSVFRSHKDIYAVINDLMASQEKHLYDVFDQLITDYPGHDLILVVQDKHRVEMIHLKDALLSPMEPLVYYRPSETLLSFNSNSKTSGQCEICKGTGRHVSVSYEAVFVRHDVPIVSGGLGLHFNSKSGEYLYFAALCDEIRGVLKARDEATNATWAQIQAETREILAMGSSDSFQPINAQCKPKGKKKPFIGLLQRIEQKLDGTSSAVQGLGHLRSDNECRACHGTRLNHAARAVYCTGRSYPELINLTLSDAHEWLNSLSKNRNFNKDKKVLAALQGICQTCVSVGLGHLQLSRATATLSGGEAQRLRIARGLWARLDHACYIIDEPTRGLHTRDILSVIKVFEKLRSEQNCVLLVEHNPFLVTHADRVIELGPEGGKGGGEVIYDGKAEGCSMLDNSVAIAAGISTQTPRGWIIVKKATLRTVFQQSFKLPLGQISCFTGVSGSGKTTLLAGVLMPALEQLQSGEERIVSTDGEVIRDGVKSFRLVYLPQSAIGGSYRSRVLSQLGLAEMFREWFSLHSMGAASGLTPSHFSSNTPEGQCLTCEGRGRVQTRGSSHETCPSCCGNGFNHEVSFASAYGLTITQWMDCSLAELEQSTVLPELVCHAAGLANDLGLGHLSLGRPVPSLSGGECQRLRIVKALLDAGNNKKGAAQQHLIMVMDEPSAGLHPKDVKHLIGTLKKNITSRGHTLLLIEHNLQLIGCTDWIVDVGPDSGIHGGKVLFAGSLTAFLKSKAETSPTYLALKGLLPEKTSNAFPSNSQFEVGNESSPQGMLEAVSRFKHYLHGEEESPDEAEAISQPVIPAYSVTIEDLSSQTFAHASGIDIDLFRFFSAESTGKYYYHVTDLDEMDQAALPLLHENWRIGWFPSPTGSEVAAWPDTAESIRAHLKNPDGEWFDGEKIRTKPPGRLPLILERIRLLLGSHLAPREAVRRALALGKGWVSLVHIETGEVRDLSMRTIEPQHLRLGSRWQVPHIFDPACNLHACILCNGKGFIESVDQDLIFKDKSRTLDSDELFQPYALEILKLARRQDLLPAAKRLKEAALIDLTVPMKSMAPTVAAMFWFGYPYKAFMKIGGKKAVLGDWHRWQGINKSVLLNMWKCSSREWAESVNASRSEMRCPECEGTGLGWEARERVVAGVSMQEINLHYTRSQLRAWLSNLQLKTGESNQARLGLIAMMDSTADLIEGNFRVFEQLKRLPQAVQQVALCKYLSNNALNRASVYIKATTQTSSKFKQILARSKAKALMNVMVGD